MLPTENTSSKNGGAKKVSRPSNHQSQRTLHTRSHSSRHVDVSKLPGPSRSRLPTMYWIRSSSLQEFCIMGFSRHSNDQLLDTHVRCFRLFSKDA